MTVHIGVFRNHVLVAYCGSKENNTYTSDGADAVKALADCRDCIQEWLTDKCSPCEGIGRVDSGACGDPECCGDATKQCPYCDVDNFLEDKGKETPAPSPETAQEKTNG
jgi:hypothetical protein